VLGVIGPAVRWRARVVPVVAVVALAGCSSSKSTNSALSTTTTAATSATVAGAAPIDLRGAIFSELPAGYIEEPIGASADGPLGLTATAIAVDDLEPARQAALLVQYGFRRAYERTWSVKGAGQTLIIRVQLMGSGLLATGYFNLLALADRAVTQFTAFATPTLVRAAGFSRAFAGATGPQVAEDVSLVRGPLFYHLIFTGPQGSVSPGNVLGIAQSQSDLAASLGYS